MLQLITMNPILYQNLIVLVSLVVFELASSQREVENSFDMLIITSFLPVVGDENALGR